MCLVFFLLELRWLFPFAFFDVSSPLLRFAGQTTPHLLLTPYTTFTLNATRLDSTRRDATPLIIWFIYLFLDSIDRRGDGDLAVSRAFGDFVYKCTATKEWREQKVSVEPVVTACERDENSAFVILACDGIWDVMSNEEASGYVCQVSLLEREGWIDRHVYGWIRVGRRTDR